jgi:hypothetical protein
VLEHIFTYYPTIAGIFLVTVFFLAGYVDFRDSGPTLRTWFWWGWGLLATISFSVFIARAGRVWPVVGTCAYSLLVCILAWANLRTRRRGVMAGTNWGTDDGTELAGGPDANS